MLIYDAGEGSVNVRDNCLNCNGENQDIIYCNEVQKHDVYGVKDLTYRGYRPNTVIDIGANIGTFSMMARKYWPNSNIMCFEPDQSCIPVLRSNCPSCIIQNTAVIGYFNDLKENEVIHECTYHTNSPEAEYRNGQNKSAISFSVLMEMISKFFTPTDHIDFLKIDCEECEVNIFREILTRGYTRHIMNIAGEWHGKAAEKQIIETFSDTHMIYIQKSDVGGIFKCQRI